MGAAPGSSAGGGTRAPSRCLPQQVHLPGALRGGPAHVSLLSALQVGGAWPHEAYHHTRTLSPVAAPTPRAPFVNDPLAQVEVVRLLVGRLRALGDASWVDDAFRFVVDHGRAHLCVAVATPAAAESAAGTQPASLAPPLCRAELLLTTGGVPLTSYVDRDADTTSGASQAGRRMSPLRMCARRMRFGEERQVRRRTRAWPPAGSPCPYPLPLLSLSVSAPPALPVRIRSPCSPSPSLPPIDVSVPSGAARRAGDDAAHVRPGGLRGAGCRARAARREPLSACRAWSPLPPRRRRQQRRQHARRAYGAGRGRGDRPA